MQNSPLHIVAIFGFLGLMGGVGVVYVRADDVEAQGREAMVDGHFDGKWLSSGLYEDFFGERLVELHLVEDEEFILRWFVRAGDRVGLMDAWVLQKMAAGTFDSETGRLEPHEFYLYALDDRELKPQDVPERWSMTITIDEESELLTLQERLDDRRAEIRFRKYEQLDALEIDGADGPD